MITETKKDHDENRSDVLNSILDEFDIAPMTAKEWAEAILKGQAVESKKNEA